MNKKQLWLVVAVLLGLNILFMTLYFLKLADQPGEEVVATIGEKEITKQDWLKEIEDRYGRDILGEMVDQEVIATMADKYKIKVSDKEVDRQLLLVKTMYGQSTSESMDDETWREQIRSSIILDELLTKDVAIKEADLKDYYQENESMFEIPPSYHVSHIIVKTEKEAKQVVKELEQGSNFATLAMERSIDEFSASLGGDIGYISEETDQYAGEYLKVVKELSANEWSDPIALEEGYAIVLLNDQLKGQRFTFKQVKASIRRQMALEQMGVSATARDFWDEAKVTWKYDENEDK